MAAINPWASWGVLSDPSWGIAAVDPWASWALCPQDPALRVEDPEEPRRVAGPPAALVQFIPRIVQLSPVCNARTFSSFQKEALTREGPSPLP
nr:zinc finger protein 606 isoform X3 [Manis javanica]